VSQFLTVFERFCLLISVSPDARTWENPRFSGTVADWTNCMKKQGWIGAALGVVLLGAGAFYGYQKWSAKSTHARTDVLAMLPGDASAVVFVDLDELRTASFITQLYAWAPKPQADPDYAQFVKETGFDYERDLDCVAVAFKRHEQDSTYFGVAQGKFNRQRISALALKTGNVTRKGGHEIFSVPVSGSEQRISFTFLRNDRIALTDGPDLGAAFSGQKGKEAKAEWTSRFERLAGSPVFAVIRQDATAGAMLAEQAPGGLRSPQLSTLLDQLQWITIAGKPENDRLRVVAEGESAAEATTRQLADLLNGVVILAEAGLNDAKTRQQLDPAARSAYLELLKSADVSKIDRGDTKSVRLVFELTPGFFESVRPLAAPSPAPAKPLPGNARHAGTGHI
jgi:hypothetical protein